MQEVNTESLSSYCCAAIVSPGSNDGVAWNNGVLDDDNDAFLDHKALLFSVALSDTLLIDDLDIGANAGIFVDDALPDFASRSCKCTLLLSG